MEYYADKPLEDKKYALILIVGLSILVILLLLIKMDIINIGSLLPTQCKLVTYIKCSRLHISDGHITFLAENSRRGALQDIRIDTFSGECTTGTIKLLRGKQSVEVDMLCQKLPRDGETFDTEVMVHYKFSESPIDHTSKGRIRTSVSS